MLDPSDQGSLAAQSALPPVAPGTTQGDQQHIVQVDPHAGDHWRRIAIAGAPSFPPFLCSMANGCLSPPVSVYMIRVYHSTS